MVVISEQEYITRIAALEKLNATLAAQVDRMRPVVTAAWGWRLSEGAPVRAVVLSEAVDAYQSAMAQLAKGEAATERLTEDYYTLAEIRLVSDLTIAEYDPNATVRLRSIVDLIDRKRPELKPAQLAKGEVKGDGAS